MACNILGAHTHTNGSFIPVIFYLTWKLVTELTSKALLFINDQAGNSFKKMCNFNSICLGNHVMVPIHTREHIRTTFNMDRIKSRNI